MIWDLQNKYIDMSWALEQTFWIFKSKNKQSVLMQYQRQPINIELPRSQLSRKINQYTSLADMVKLKNRW